MPKISHDEDDDFAHDYDIKVDLNVEPPEWVKEFMAGFRKTFRGNLHRFWCGYSLTVFRHYHGYKFAIGAPGEKTLFSRVMWRTEEEVLRILALEMRERAEIREEMANGG
jgi:hypothetical protein